MIIASAFALVVAHPGPVFGLPRATEYVDDDVTVESKAKSSSV